MTVAPLPAWRNIFGIVFGRTCDAATLSAPWRREGEMTGWLSRSAWSLMLIAFWRRRLHTGSSVVWLPDYFCNSTLTPLRAMGAELVFYPVNAKLEPDMAACRQLALATPPGVFILVHYFGLASKAAPAAREFCVRRAAWLVEDAAHALRPCPGIGQQGDFVLYSPHKLLAIPDGAVLVVRPDGPGNLGRQGVAALGEPGTWGKTAAQQVAGRLALRSNAGQALTWLGKRILQGLGLSAPRQTSTPFEETVNEARATRFSTPEMSWLGRRLLGRSAGILANAALWRRRNLLLWDDLLLRSKSGGDLQGAERPQSRFEVPYLACFESQQPNAATTYRLLRQQGLTVMTWPDLPPEVVAERVRHDGAWMLRHRRLYLPLHQGLRPKDLIGAAAACIGQSLPSPHSALSGLRLAWDAISREQWHEWMIRAGRSNLLQSWEYGNAKAKSEGWRIVRGVAYLMDEPVAIVQALEKRLPGVGGVVRINRGPLFLAELPPDHLRMLLEQVIARSTSGIGKTVLSFSPELALSGAYIRLLAEIPLRQYSPHGWRSIWLDLRMGEEALRKNLDAKWRNMLVKAEKQEMNVRVSAATEDFEWLTARCRSMMTGRGVGAPPVGLYRALHAEMQGGGNSMVVFRALSGDESIAGICVVTHGKAATYLLGWNGEAARKLNANYVLLWQAALWLRSRGIEWFDLGGVNNDETPGIAAFKQGMNGSPYELVGTYWR